jgi:hypothetical protein
LFTSQKGTHKVLNGCPAAYTKVSHLPWQQQQHPHQSSSTISRSHHHHATKRSHIQKRMHTNQDAASTKAMHESISRNHHHHHVKWYGLQGLIIIIIIIMLPIKP